MSASESESEYLADAFATIAREMQAATAPGETRLVVTRRAVEMVPGCTYAGMTLVHRNGSVTSVAPTSEAADRIHLIQNDLGEGPCLSSIHDHVVSTVEDLRHDERWPRFGRRIAEDKIPIASMLAFRLFTSEDTTGALGLYSDTPHAFDTQSRAIGTVLAAHAAIAMAAARERENAENLEIALHNSRQIGIAIGILINSRKLDQDRAFQFLANVSQRLNRKLHDVAGVIAEAGAIPGDLAERS